MKKISLLLILVTSVLSAGGYKIPEVSLNAVALSAANVAHNKSSDAAYYNPANMVFMKDEASLEFTLSYIGLSEIDYKGSHQYSAGLGGAFVPNVDTHSQKEDFLIPSFFYVSPKIDGVRFGFAMVVPAGLSKRWEDQPAESASEEFTLETVELNPSVAFPMNDDLALALGFRAIYSKGIVKAQLPGVMSQDMDGDSVDFGFNVALSYKATDDLELAVTYRSKIDLEVEGDADLFYSPGGTIDPVRNVDVSVEVPVAAQLNVALAYTFPTKTTFEFVYERTYWSSYSSLNFNYEDPTAEAVFGTSKPKDWDDTNSFRFGITQELDKLTLMAGCVIDETPVPEETLAYELPDSDSVSVSFGGRYQVNEKLSTGMAALYSMREDRKVTNDTLNGEFTDSSVLIVSVGLEYKF